MFAVLDAHGTILRRLENRPEAIGALEKLAAKLGREEVAENYAVMEFDESGKRVGELITMDSPSLF
jgi:hypothetical protein